MTYKEFISKMEAHSFCTLNFGKTTFKNSTECLILYVECEAPIAALSLVDDDWQFINPSASFDATFLGAMAELADTPKEQRGKYLDLAQEWEETDGAKREN